MLKVYIKIDELLKKTGLTQKELSLKTGVRQAAISEMARNKREKISLEHLEKIANALNIRDINELITIKEE